MQFRITLVLAGLLFSAVPPVQAQTGSPAGPIPVDLLKQRRARLLDRIGNGVVVIKAAQLQDVDADEHPQASDFRQQDNFFYLTGLETPDAQLVLVASTSGADSEILYIAPRDPEQEQWTGERLDAAEAAATSGIRDVRTNNRAASDLRAQPATIADGAVHQHVAALRLIKDADELRRLQRSIDITTGALRAAMSKARPGQYEYEIEAVIEYEFRRAGAERVGFPSIVASGPNTTTLHYDRNRRRTVAGDLIVMDVGSEFGYYSADVTRTIPVSGKFTPRQRALYDLVLGAQQAAMDAVRPGQTIMGLEAVARGYMQRNSGSLCGTVTCDGYFVHGLSHWLGMDVHDPGDYGTPLAPGMVFTIEPGIYIAAEGLGIRIEDDILVTASGYELMSKGAPRRAQDIEAVMMGGNK